MSFADAMTSFKAGDYQTAAEQFAAVTEQDEHNHKAWNALGICLSKTGEYEHAGICFENATLLDPNNPIYKKNKEKNDNKRGIVHAESLELDDEPVRKAQRNTVQYIQDVDPDVGRAPFWLGLTGFIFGILISLFLIMAGGFFGAFGVSGSGMIGGRGWILIILCLVGFGAVFVKHKRYGGLLLLLTGVLILIALGGFGIITGLFYAIAGILIIRKTGFNLLYYLDLREDPFKKSIFTLIIVGCLIITMGAVAAPNSGTKSISPITSSINSDLGVSSSSSNVAALPAPNKSPTLENYTIYAGSPTNSKSGVLIWDYDATTDEYLYQFTTYSTNVGAYMADRSKASWGKRGFIEAMCKVKIAKIDINRPFEKYSITYYPEA